MSALTFAKLFEPAQLTATLATYYTVPTPSTNLLKNAIVRVSNTTGTARTVDIHAVPKSGSAGDDNALVKSYTIPANDYRDIIIGQMKEGDFIQAKADAATSVTIHSVDGNLYTP